MNQLLKKSQKAKTLAYRIRKTGSAISDNNLAVVARANGRDIEWYFADNIAGKSTRKSR